MVQDLISSFVACLNQSSKAKKKTTVVRYSRMVEKICSILYRKGYLLGYKVINNHYIAVELKYYNNLPLIHGLKRISRPGRRIYMSNTQIKNLHTYIHGDSEYVITTSSGVYTAKECIIRGLSGEVLFKIN
jgi:small subunit ribosomal protein S8